MRAEGDYQGACDEYHGLLASRVPGTQVSAQFVLSHAVKKAKTQK